MFIARVDRSLFMMRSMNRPHSASNPQPDAPALDRADAEQAARMLDRLAEMAMERAEAMHAASLAAIKAGDTAAAKDLEISLGRIARSIRRTLALKLHLAQKRQEMAQKAAAHARDRAEEKEKRRRRVAARVSCSIGGDDSVDAEKGEALLADPWERLVEDEDIDAALALADHPLEEIVIASLPRHGHPPGSGLAEPRLFRRRLVPWPRARRTTSPKPEAETEWWPRAARRRPGISISRESEKTPPGWIDSLLPRSSSTARPRS